MRDCGKIFYQKENPLVFPEGLSRFEFLTEALQYVLFKSLNSAWVMVLVFDLLIYIKQDTVFSA